MPQMLTVSASPGCSTPRAVAQAHAHPLLQSLLGSQLAGGKIGTTVVIAGDGAGDAPLLQQGGRQVAVVGADICQHRALRHQIRHRLQAWAEYDIGSKFAHRHSPYDQK